MSFDILPGAKPFAVAAVGETGSAVIQVDPVSGTWPASMTEPTQATRAGNFLVQCPDIVVLDFISCRAALPSNNPPETRQLGTGIVSSSGNAPAGSRFSISLPNDIRFGGWLRLPWGPFATHASSFKLYVDGKLIASQEAVYQLLHR